MSAIRPRDVSPAEYQMAARSTPINGMARCASAGENSESSPQPFPLGRSGSPRTGSAEPERGGVGSEDSVIGAYDTHGAAEQAIREFRDAGLPIDKMTIVSWKYETREDIQGFYQPAGAVLEGACQGALFGGILTLSFGLGLLLLPHARVIYASAVGVSVVLAAVLGAIIRGIAVARAPRHLALKYNQHTEPGSVVIVFHDDIASYQLGPEEIWPPPVNHTNIGRPDARALAVTVSSYGPPTVRLTDKG